MSLRTITKIACFVISLFVLSASLGSCSGLSYGGSETSAIDANASPYSDPEILSRISSVEISESSGLAVSGCQNNVFWTHNDSGGGPFLYAFNAAGETLGVWRVSEASNVDWEDMATIVSADGKCDLYIADVGDNERKRDVLTIYRFAEPSVAANSSNLSREKAVATEKAESLRFKYPNGRHNAEALLVNPITGAIYAVTKSSNGPAEVFGLDAKFNSSEVQTAIKLADISLPASPVGLVTGGAISPDGKRIVMCDYSAGYEFTLPATANAFDEILFQKPTPFNLGPRFIGESIAFGVDSNTVFATTEKPGAPLIRIERKK